ncbi:MAG TPA: WYL domain-containing protein [Acidothermales bacterium]
MMKSSGNPHLTRMLALVPYLLARPGARLADVAQTFGVSEKRLRDDLDLLFMCGLPGHLPDDLIEVSLEGDRIHVWNADTIARPLRLTQDEALSLLVGLRTLAGIRGLEDRGVLDRTIAKLERAAGEAAASASTSVAVDVEAEGEVLAAARRALAEGRLVHLRYYVPGRDEATERDVDPMRVIVVEGRPYLEGWCRMVLDVRLFRLDRVLGIEVLDQPAAVPAHARPRPLDAGLFQPSINDVVVTLELTAAGRWVRDYYPYESVEELPDGRLLLRLRTPDPRWIRRLALRLGDTGRVLDPPQLVADVRGAAAAALEAYQRQPVG